MKDDINHKAQSMWLAGQNIPLYPGTERGPLKTALDRCLNRCNQLQRVKGCHESAYSNVSSLSKACSAALLPINYVSSEGALRSPSDYSITLCSMYNFGNSGET